MMFGAHALFGIISYKIPFLWMEEGRPRIIIGLTLAFLSHGILDAFSIFTYHEMNPFGTIFQKLVYFGWCAVAVVIIVYIVRLSRSYFLPVCLSFFFDIWDHLILGFIQCTTISSTSGCMRDFSPVIANMQLHRLEWFLLENFFSETPRFHDNPWFIFGEVFTITLLFFIFQKMHDNGNSGGREG